MDDLVTSHPPKERPTTHRIFSSPSQTNNRVVQVHTNLAARFTEVCGKICGFLQQVAPFFHFISRSTTPTILPSTKGNSDSIRLEQLHEKY